MRLFPGWKRLKDVSISKKLYFIVGTMAVLIALELFTLWFAIHTLSSVRTLVGAEGLYSKAQKDGIYQLEKYYRTHQEHDYQAFLNFMAVPLGDHKTRMELLKPKPDMKVARQGFIEGRFHPDDIDGAIQLLRRFHSIRYISKAISLWTQGDSLIAEILPVGELFHAEMISAHPSQQRLDSLIGRIDPINQQLTKLEDEFSFTLGEGSRWLENIILKLLFTMALTVEITGLALTMSVSRSITRGLKAINRASDKISKGELQERARVYSDDEIGQVATAMNRMTEQLVRSNTELSHFAYIASHDLQEPLRTVSIYVELFRKKYASQLDETANKYLQSITGAAGRMQALIRDVLDYSRIGYNRQLQELDTARVVQEVQADMAGVIRGTGAQIEAGPLPVISGYAEFRALIQNLVSNAIKFRQEGLPPQIRITARDEGKEWLFLVKDNGVGIEAEYHDRIFTIFQKLHSQSQYPGTGIGLAHCRKIVELHGGKIWVTSEPGKGSTFYFTIPKAIRP